MESPTLVECLPLVLQVIHRFNSIEFRIHEKNHLLCSSIIVNSKRVSTSGLSIFIFIHILTEFGQFGIREIIKNRETAEVYQLEGLAK